MRGDIDHEPWSLQPGEAEVSENTMTDPLGISVDDSQAIVHFASSIQTVAWTLTATAAQKETVLAIEPAAAMERGGE